MAAVWESVWDTLALGEWYDAHPWAVDGLVYLVLFVGIAKVTLGRRYDGRGGAAVVAAVGTALAVAAATFAYRSGFTLASLGPTAWLVLLTLIGILLFDLGRSAGVPVLPAAALSVLVMVTAAAGIGRALDEWFVQSGLLPVVQLLALAAIAVTAWWIASSVGRLGRGLRPGQRSAVSAEQGAAAAAEPVQALERLDASIVELLERLIALVRSGGIAEGTERLLREIERRDRMVNALYQQVLRTLAGKRWKAAPDRERLPDQLKRVLIAVKDNLSEFDRNLEVARVAHDRRNAPLLLGALSRLLALERSSLRLADALRNFLARMRGDETATLARKGSR